MNDTELDAAYTHICKTMTQLGEPASQLFLARFALLAIDYIGDASKIDQLIAAAKKNLAPSA